MNTQKKRDLSISVASRAGTRDHVPVAILQFSLFALWNGAGEVSVTLNLLNMLTFALIVAVSIVLHEFIHGFTWWSLGKSLSRRSILGCSGKF